MHKVLRITTNRPHYSKRHLSGVRDENDRDLTFAELEKKIENGGYVLNAEINRLIPVPEDPEKIRREQIAAYSRGNRMLRARMVDLLGGGG